MPTITYPTYDISLDAIYDALVLEGVVDPVFEVNGELKITADAITQVQADNAIALAAPTGLLTNKIARKAEIGVKTVELLDLGVTVTLTNGVETFGLSQLREDFGFYWALHTNIVNVPATAPIPIWNKDLSLFTMQNATDALNLATEAQERFWYILDAVQNADSSYGDAGLKDQIDAAANQAALDAIVDTRT